MRLDRHEVRTLLRLAGLLLALPVALLLWGLARRTWTLDHPALILLEGILMVASWFYFLVPALLFGSTFFEGGIGIAPTNPWGWVLAMVFYLVLALVFTPGVRKWEVQEAKWRAARRERRQQKRDKLRRERGR